MQSATSDPQRLTPLEPFGVEVRAAYPGASLADSSVEQLRGLVRSHRLVVLRSFGPLEGKAFPEWCAGWGEILRWSFGEVLELEVREDARNYLFTNGSVPFHWDGAFAGAVPGLQVFHCPQAPHPGAGGETLFCDTPSLLRGLAPGHRQAWDQVEITYTTEKVVHYGGRITARLVARHPDTGEPVLRYAEPPDADTAPLNPLSLEVAGTPEAEALLAEIRSLLYDPRFAYAHRWRDGDYVIADNHALLHARRRFRAHSPRRLRRVHVL